MLVRDSIGLVYIPLFVSWLVHFVSCATELRVKNHMDLISSFNLPPPPQEKRRVSLYVFKWSLPPAKRYFPNPPPTPPVLDLH